MYSVTEDRWYPLQEAEGRLSDYAPATHSAHSIGTENVTVDKKIDELWSKFLSAYRPTSTIGARPTWCCDLYTCELGSEELPAQKCTCSSGNSHGDRGSRDAPGALPSGDTMSLREACETFKSVFIESSKRRQRDIKCRPVKGKLSFKVGL